MRSLENAQMGVFDFSAVIDGEYTRSDAMLPLSDGDSYFSDCGIDFTEETFDCNADTKISSEHSLGNHASNLSSDNELIYHDNVEVVDDEEQEAVHSDNDELCNTPYFTSPMFPDAHIPLCGSTFDSDNFSPPGVFLFQLELHELFNRNKGSLKMYDEMIAMFNKYISATDFNSFARLMNRNAFLNRVEELFHTSDLKPTYGLVSIHNGAKATVPVFDTKAMILSILHDASLMRNENFAAGLDIFTGYVDDECPSNKSFGEIHTGNAWKPAVQRFCGHDGKYMPFAMIVFGDKSHTDLHGSLSLTPITFTATFFNRNVRNNPDCWRPLAYIPNLTHGKGGGGNSRDKVQDEHNCLAYAFKSLIELSELGGIRTMVMGKEVIVKPFIHFFIGDTEGMNKWLGHYSGSKPGVSRPYRDCHCGFEDLNAPNIMCTYTKASEFRRAIRLVEHDKKAGLKMLKSLSRHYINNAMYQSKLPLSDAVHGANKMCPPECLHTLDAGLTIYMLESLQGLMSGGKSREDLDNQHVRMFHSIRRQSERDFPRGALRSGLIDTTRCQSSERKGNFFLLLCIANTADGALILNHELNYKQKHWEKWVHFLKLYLAMGEWFHASRPKDEVCRAGDAIGIMIKSIQLYFPRGNDSHGYNIPKMHGLAKMKDYICELEVE